MLGTITGAAVALLMAPSSGEETRRLLAEKAREGRERANDAARQEASIAGATGAEFSYLASATERFLDWSPGPDADRLAIDLLITGLEALAERSTRD